MSRYPPVSRLNAQQRVVVVKDIFTTSYSRYDFLNHLLSLRRDVGWRRFTVERMRFFSTRRLLDVATGTADLAIAAAQRYPDVEATGIDFAEPMLSMGRRKLRRLGLDGRIRLAAGDALSLGFPDSAFDVSAIAFGMRNIPDKLSALREMARVTVAGGQVMVLEMSFAPAPFFRGIYRLYLNRMLPLISAPFAPNGAAYSYLADSIMHFPSPEAFRDLMRQAGLTDIVYHSLSFGLAHLYIGRTPGHLPGGA